MRVDDRNVVNSAALGQLSESQSVQRDSRTSGSASERGVGAEDQVEISGLSSKIGQEMERVESQRVERVQQLAELYRSGQYQVDSQAASRAMVNETLAAGKSE